MRAPEAESLTRAVDGDAKALAMLMRRHGPEVRRRLKISPTWRAVLDAADIMQVTYFEAFLHIHDLDARDVETFVAWLQRIAENNLRDAIRELERAKRPNPRHRVQPQSANESVTLLLDTLISTSATASKVLAAREARELLEAAIRQLPEDYQEVVRLFDLEGRSAVETAKVMGRSRGGVYVLRTRAHDRLREILGGSTQFFSTG